MTFIFPHHSTSIRFSIHKQQGKILSPKNTDTFSPAMDYTTPKVLILLYLTRCIWAPFPPDHPYNVFNPWIEPWWEQLTKTEQKAIYSRWQQVEPAALALAEAVEAKDRLKQALINYAKDKFALLKLKMTSGDDDYVLVSPSANGYAGYGLTTATRQQKERLQAARQVLLHLKEALKEAKKEVLRQKWNLLKASNGTKNGGGGVKNLKSLKSPLKNSALRSEAAV